MAAEEADAKAEGTKRPERSASPAPAPAAVPAAKAKAKAARAPTSDAESSFWCMLLSVLFLCSLFLGVLGLAYADIFPGTLVRPYFFGSPHALTKANWDDKTAGRTVFLKMYAPWCGHCKKLAPAWDKLTAQNADHSFLQVGEVDCTGTGKSLCQELGVSGYPTLKYGDPMNLQDYKGGRTFEDMSKFAAELGPTCSPAQLQACSEEEKNMIEEYQAMGAEKRQAKILEQEAEAEKLQAAFKAFTDSLSSDYKEATDKKEEAVKAVKDGGLTTLKAIAAHEAQPQRVEAIAGKGEESEKGEKAEL